MQDGEECDDGNTDSGDGCLADCTLPGALITETVLDFGNASEDLGHEVVIGSDDAITVLLKSNAGMRIAKYDAGMEMVYIKTPLLTDDSPNLAIAPNDFVVIGGESNNIDQTRQFNFEGDPNWTASAGGDGSSILAVVVDSEGFAVAAPELV